MRFALITCVALFPGRALADGGAVILSKVVGQHRVTLFGGPTPIQAGPCDFSVLVQSTVNGRIVHVPVRIELTQGGLTLGGPATTESATNKLLQAVTIELPRPGLWQIAVQLGDDRLTPIDIPVQPATSGIDGLVWWIVAPFAGIALFLAHRRLDRP